MFVSGKFVDCDLLWLLESEVTLGQKRKDIETYEHGFNKRTALQTKCR
jgi:hypothetical protein